MENELVLEQEFTYYKNEHKITVLTEYYQCLIAKDLMMQSHKLPNLSNEEFDKMVRILAKGYLNNLIENSSIEEINLIYETAWEELKEYLP